MRWFLHWVARWIVWFMYCLYWAAFVILRFDTHMKTQHPADVWETLKHN